MNDLSSVLSPKPDYTDFFPFLKLRPEQKRAIKFALDAFLKEGKRIVVLEMGPGCGKSATGVAIARYLQAIHELGDSRILLGGSYILTTQKVLQEQYMNDFGPPKGQLKLLKSSNSYTCRLFDQSTDKITCGEVQRILKSGARCGTVFKMCKKRCRFNEARKEFFDSVEGTTNYAYFLTASAYTKAVVRRGLLILDEAHNFETAMGSFVKVGFSNFFYKSILGISMPPVSSGQTEIFEWIRDKCVPALAKVVKRKKKEISETDDSNEAIARAKIFEKLDRHMCKINRFIDVYNPFTWVLDSVKTDRRGERVYEFKPTDVSEHCREMIDLHCDRALLFSATILDKEIYCKSIGFDPNDVAFLRIPSPFPVKNRPIHYLPVGKMSRDSIVTTLPKMVEIVKMLLERHSQDKGIIHCVNYRIARHLEAELTSATGRLLLHGTKDRDVILKRHLTEPGPTVLVSPSMMEGVDLADDMSRFQILCKVPFPYLGDAAIRRRMKLDNNWYGYQTVKSVLQAFGRSIRNSNDHAESYILDADWKRFFQMNKHMFPDEFSAALI